MLIFLTNDVVIEEWKRNKPSTESQIKELENKYKSYSESLKSIKTFVKEDIEEVFHQLRSELEVAYTKKVSLLKKHIIDVEEFLINNTQRIPVTDNVKIEATNLALERKAPFIGDKKNSMADALILLSAIEHLHAEHMMAVEIYGNNVALNNYPESYFVSSNKGDFSSPHDKEIIHPDLQPKLNKTNTVFYYTLGKLINSFEQEFLTIDEQRAIEFADDRFYCDHCDSSYYPSVHFSQEFYVPDSGKSDEFINQYWIDFENLDTGIYQSDDFLTAIRTANCSNCGAEYIECPCGTVNYLEDYEKIRCIGECGRTFIIHADIDKKGTVHSLDYEIIRESECQSCGNFVKQLNDSDLCSDCEESYSYR